MTWEDVYEVTGILGIDPEPLSLRELWWMVHGRDKDTWSKLSAICATLYNASGCTKEKVSPDEFNPYANKEKKTKGTKSIPLKMFSRHVCKQPREGGKDG